MHIRNSPHRGVCTSDPKLLQHLRISLDKLLHCRLHVVMRHQRQLTHLRWLEFTFEGLGEIVGDRLDLRKKLLIKVRPMGDGLSLVRDLYCE